MTVTGGAGYIGALLVAELTTGGWDVTVLDSLLHGQATVASAVAGLGARRDRQKHGRCQGAHHGYSRLLQHGHQSHPSACFSTKSTMAAATSPCTVSLRMS